MERDSLSDDEIKKIYSMKNIAVVGMSKHPEKAAHFVPKYLSENGYNIIPVNPTTDSIMEKKCYHNLDEVSDSIDVSCGVSFLIVSFSSDTSFSSLSPIAPI